MPDFLRSELRRCFSGYAMLVIAAFAILLPSMALGLGPSLDGLRAIDDTLATRIVFGLIASAGIMAMYAGSFSVSREYYYRSIERSFVMGSRRRVFVAKFGASMLTTVLIAVVAMVLWAAVTAVLLGVNGRQLDVGPAFWGIAGGTVLIVVLASVLGVAVGWILRNYYLTTAVVLLIPTMIESPLLFSAPEIERFLPLGAFAGLTGAPIDGLLPWWGSALVLLGWSTAAVIGAVIAVRRREQ